MEGKMSKTLHKQYKQLPILFRDNKQTGMEQWTEEGASLNKVEGIPLSSKKQEVRQ